MTYENHSQEMPMGHLIMIVDDSAMIRMQVKRALKGAGHEVLEAVDGVDALAKLEGRNPALLVCDVNMPRMNGLELLEQLKARGFGAPIVMLTTEGQPDMIRKARLLGAKGWMIKPFKPEMLLASVKKLVAMAA